MEDVQPTLFIHIVEITGDNFFSKNVQNYN